MRRRAISCHFGPGYAMPLYTCCGCQDGQRARMLWRPPYWFWVRVSPGFMSRGPFPPRSRVCRTHTVTKKHRREAPYIAA